MKNILASWDAAAQRFADNPHANTWKAFKAAHALRGPRYSVITNNNIRKYISKNNMNQNSRRTASAADFFRALNKKKNNRVLAYHFLAAFNKNYNNQARRKLGINK